MRRNVVTLAALALFALPIAAEAQSLQGLLFPAAQTTTPPPGQPHAFTAAPVSNLGVSGVDPGERAGGADDAGPMNATPFSGSVGTVLTGSQTARALSDTKPTTDPAASSQFRE